MRIKLISFLEVKKVEKEVNSFLDKNMYKIQVKEIRWKSFIVHSVMIMYEELK